MGRKICTNVFLSFVLSLVLLQSVISAPSQDEYMALRAQLEEEDAKALLGSSLNLTDPREVAVNDILMQYKLREYAEGLESNGGHFAAAQHFFHARSLIEGSKVFQLIKLLPKGAALHMHDPCVPRAEYVVSTLTKWDNLYYCNDNDYLSFRFFGSQPTEPCDTNKIKQWRLVSELRNQSSSPEFVDSWFLDSMTLFTPEPDVSYPTINYVWKQFEATIATVAGIAGYEPALREYHYQTLKEFYDDNVMYIESRGLLTGVYHLNQTELSTAQTLQVYKEVTDKFMADHPDFFGAKYIYAPHRFHPAPELTEMLDLTASSNEASLKGQNYMYMQNYENQVIEPNQSTCRIQSAKQLKSQFPDFFTGFDLVGQEDLGTPLKDYLPQLLDAAASNISFFFHAGETAWHGTQIDENLIDALLLNTTRIGHGYALASHPVLANQVQERGIAVEVCPISNQVLKLVDDIRNHPAISLMKDGFPLVISSDDPGIWGASGLSYDWYIAFMGMGGKKADLRFLKQLAINSIQYSAMTASEKQDAMAAWQNRWSAFLDKVLEDGGKNGDGNNVSPEEEH